MRKKTRKKADVRWTKIALLPVLKNLYASGMTDRDVAIILGISKSTIGRWLKYKPDIKQAKGDGKKLLRGLVYAEMVRTAIGYDYVEKDIKYIERKDKDSDEYVIDSETRQVIEKKKHQPANPYLLQFLAQNLMPEEFPKGSTVEQKLQLVAGVEPDRLKKFAERLKELQSGQLPVVEGMYENRPEVVASSENIGGEYPVQNGTE